MGGREEEKKNGTAATGEGLDDSDGVDMGEWTEGGRGGFRAR